MLPNFQNLNLNEQLAKFSKDKIEEAKTALKKQKEVLKGSFDSIKSRLEREYPNGVPYAELEAARQTSITEAKAAIETQTAIPKLLFAENGKYIAKHKNKLGFIFIGDTIKSENLISTERSLNSPKIAMVIGGGLEGSETKIDPREDHVQGCAAQFHMISYADIDVKGILPINKLMNRSAIKMEADVAEISGKDIVLIRSRGDSYNSSGTRTFGPGGVHIVSGNKDITEPEPMVLGKQLSKALVVIVDMIGELNTSLIDLNLDILELKTNLLLHSHMTLGPAGPTSPSLDLALSVAPTIAIKNSLGISNGYSRLINIEQIKLNNLTALSANNFLSKFNRVN